MAGSFLSGFSGMTEALDKLSTANRKASAYSALRNTYGDIAGDPAAAAELQKINESTQAFPLLQQGRQQAIDTSKQNMETSAATEAEKQRVTRGNELLSGALFIQNARKRDPNVDVGQLFDRIAPTLNLSPQDAAAARATLTADPGAADDLVTAFRLKQGAEKGDPAAVQIHKYFQWLSPQEQTSFLRANRPNASPEIAGEVAGAQANARQQATLDYAAPIAAAKAENTAVGKAKGEKTASELPLSSTEQVKAQQIYESAIQGFEVADKSIDNAVGETNWLSAGPLSHLPDFANPSAAALRSDLTGAMSQVVLQTISQLKELSKTGATGFGQLSDKEGALIGAKFGAVLQATTPQRLKKALGDLKTQMSASRGIYERAYLANQKARGDKTSAPAPASQGSRVEGDNVILKWNPAKGDFE